LFVCKNPLQGCRDVLFGSKNLLLVYKAFLLGSKNLLLVYKAFLLGRKIPLLVYKALLLGSKNLLLVYKAFLLGSKDLLLVYKNALQVSKKPWIGCKSRNLTNFKTAPVEKVRLLSSWIGLNLRSGVSYTSKGDILITMNETGKAKICCFNNNN